MSDHTDFSDLRIDSDGQIVYYAIDGERWVRGDDATRSETTMAEDRQHTMVTTADGQTWIEITPPQSRDTSKGKLVARVVRECPAGFDGTFPHWCNRHMVALDVTPTGGAGKTVFYPVADEAAGLALIAEQFAKCY
jgi:hypothetical protein